MSVEVYFEKGAVGTLHNHPHEQLTYVLDALYKEPNVMHGCVCLEKGVLLDNFTPMRKDFIA